MIFPLQLSSSLSSCFFVSVFFTTELSFPPTPLSSGTLQFMRSSLRTRETYQTSAVLAMTVPKMAPETNPVMNRTAMSYIEKLYDWYNAYK